MLFSTSGFSFAEINMDEPQAEENKIEQQYEEKVEPQKEETKEEEVNKDSSQNEEVKQEEEEVKQEEKTTTTPLKTVKKTAAKGVANTKQDDVEGESEKLSVHFIYKDSSNNEADKTVLLSWNQSTKISSKISTIPKTITTDTIKYTYNKTWTYKGTTFSETDSIKASDYTGKTDIYFYANYNEVEKKNIEATFIYMTPSGEKTATRTYSGFDGSSTITATIFNNYVKSYQNFDYNGKEYTFKEWQNDSGEVVTSYVIDYATINNNTKLTFTAQYDAVDIIVPVATIHINYMNKQGKWVEHTFSNEIPKGVSWTVKENAFIDDIDLEKEFDYDGKRYTFTQWDNSLPFTIKNIVKDTDYYFTAQYNSADIINLNVKYTDNVANGSSSASNQGTTETYTHTFKKPADIPAQYEFLYWEGEGKQYAAGEKLEVNFAELEEDTNMEFVAVYNYQPAINFTYHYLDKIKNNIYYEDVDIYKNEPVDLYWFYDDEQEPIPKGEVVPLPDKIETTKKLNIEQKVDVYAHYFTITWINYNDSTLWTSEFVPYGEMPTYGGDEPTKKATKKYTYNWISWDKEVVPATENTTYQAVYESVINKYSVTFVDYDDSVIQGPTEYNYGTAAADITVPQDPIRKATKEYTYTFDGWTPEFEEVTDNITYKATYKATKNKYTVKFINWDGETLSEKDYLYGTPANEIEQPTASRPNTKQYTYTFAGWTPEVEDVTDNAVYLATYNSNLNKYTVLWINDDGNILEIDVDVPYGNLPEYNGDEPTKKADKQYTYSFKEWTPKIEEVTGDTVYTATYDKTVNEYTIKFINDDGELLSKKDYPYGTLAKDIQEPDEPTKESTPQYSYTFDGWTPVIQDVTGDMTYTATYVPAVNKYKVTWENEDGTVLEEDEEVPYGTIPEYNKDTPTKESDAQYTYTFEKWTPEIVKVTNDAVYTATYSKTINKYKIEWVNEDGSELETDLNVPYGTMPEYNGDIPTKKATAEFSYEFIGWNPEITKVEGNAKYVAVYKPIRNNYTVTWINEDGKELEKDLNVPYGEMPEYNGDTPTKKADAKYTYNFKNWTPEVSIVTGNITYTATYTATVNKYPVTFVDYDGSIIQEAIEYNYGTAPTDIAVPQDPTRKATEEFIYEFNGWMPEIQIVTKEAIYQATYKAIKKEYVVKFIDEDGTELSSKIYHYGEMPGYDGDTPVKKATPQYTYEFNGWTPEIVEVKEDATYTATYKPTIRKYTVTYKPGTQGTFKETSITVDYGSKTPSAPKTTCNEGYGFKKWDPEIADVVTENATYIAQWKKNEKPVVPDEDDPQKPDKDNPVPPREDSDSFYDNITIFYGMGDNIDISRDESTIGKSPLPLTNSEQQQYWALLNLILAILSCMIGLLLIALGIINKYEEDEDTEVKNKWWSRIIAILVGILSIIIFFLTENMNNPWIWIDNWTIVMFIMFVINIIFAIVSKHKVKEEVDK